MIGGKVYRGFNGIDYTDWILFKLIIKVYGEDKLIEVLQDLKSRGGIKEIRTIG